MSSTKGDNAVGNQLVYERRLGARNQIEVIVPVDFHESEAAPGRGASAIVAFALRRTFFASMQSGTIAAAGAEVALPTGNEDKGLGNGYAIYEPFAMWGQMLPHNSYLQMHGGIEFPSDSSKGDQGSVPAHGHRDDVRAGSRLRAGVVAAGGVAVGATVRRIVGMGRGAADPGVALEASACADCRRRARAAH